MLKKDIWVTVQKVICIEKISEMTFYRRFKKNYYPIYRYVESKTGGRGGKILQIALSCLKPELQAKYYHEFYQKNEDYQNTLIPIPAIIPVCKDNQSNIPAIHQNTLSTIPLDKALAKYDLITKYEEYQFKSSKNNKTKAKKEFQQAYNMGALCPALFNILGPLHWATIERWKRRITSGNIYPITALTDNWGY